MIEKTRYKKTERKKNKDDENIVVAMRCIDMVPHASIIDKKPCSECGEMTWISVSLRNKDIDRVVCDHCFFKNEKYKDKDNLACVTEECLNDAFEYLRDSGYNTTKEDMLDVIEKKIGKKIKVVKDIVRKKYK